MNILLDENIPVRLASALNAAGHQVDTVASLRLIGIDNGRLLRLAIEQYDLCFTKDSDFAKRARESKSKSQLRVIRVQLAQKPETEFIEDFMNAFVATDWSARQNGEHWPG